MPSDLHPSHHPALVHIRDLHPSVMDAGLAPSDILLSRRNAASEFDFTAAIIIYDALEIFSIVLLSAVLITAWASRAVERSAPWFLLMISGILCSVIGSLLFGHQTGAEPPRGVCSVQAVLVYGFTILLPLSAFAFTLQIYLSTIVFARRSRVLSSVHNRLLYAIPIFPSAMTIVATSIIGAKDASLLQRDPSGMRCHVITSQIFYWTISACGLSTFGIVVLDVLIAINIHRASRSSSFQTASHTHRLPTPNTALRLYVFTLFGVLTLLAAFVPWVFHQRTLPAQVIYNYTMAIIPVALGLILGVRKDVLNVWAFWKSY